MQHRKSSRAGNAVIEFTLVGIPVILLLVSIFEISRGMWMYHTLASAVKEGARFAIVHGNDCNITPSNCAVRIRDVSNRIRQYAIGMPANEIRNVTFTSRTRAVVCETLANCLASGGQGSTYWPAAAPGASVDSGGESMMGWVEVAAEYNFRSAIAMLWPGAGRGKNFGAVLLPASSREVIQY